MARPPLAITMSLCAGTAVANEAEKRPLLSTHGEWGEGALGGAHGSTQLHPSLHPWAGTPSPSATNTGDLSLGALPGLSCLCGPTHPPWGPPQPPRELPQRGFLLPREIKPRADEAPRLGSKLLSKYRGLWGCSLRPCTLVLGKGGLGGVPTLGPSRMQRGWRGAEHVGNVGSDTPRANPPLPPLPLGPTCCLDRSQSLPS